MNEVFHFSPRPNRAAEIGWRPWALETFAQAQAQDKPVLLAISAVWCHWCHVMDETSYSDSSVIEYINEHFIPVRVDNDRRPDINARYNMGGWPTTALLAPDGTTLTGGTYIPPREFLQTLERVDQFYRENRQAISQKTAELAAPRAASRPPASDPLHPNMVARVVEEIVDSYDPEYGGFGEAPKFPHTESLELLLLEYRLSDEQRLYEILAKTIFGMSRGGMYDHVEGGFFRYSTTRDWSVPHFEKMTEDHAGLLHILAVLFAVTRNDEFRTTLVSALGYVRTTLRDSQSGFFAGSQDADETYFSLPLDERRRRETPYVDRTSYSNWTAAMASAFLAAGYALDDDALTGEALLALDRLHDALRDGDGMLYHYVVPGAAPEVSGLLTDQAAYLRALLDAHEYSGEERFIARALEIAQFIERFAAEDGTLLDRSGGEEIGGLRIPNRPIAENSSVADSLLRLAALNGEPSYRERAVHILAGFSRQYGRLGSFAAGYARAVRRALSAVTEVRIIGEASETSGFREAARSLPDPLAAIRTIASSNRRQLELLGLTVPDRTPVAYVCREQTCAAPAFAPGDLPRAFASLKS